jgi:hypothetical protein
LELFQLELGLELGNNHKNSGQFVSLQRLMAAPAKKVRCASGVKSTINLRELEEETLYLKP